MKKLYMIGTVALCLLMASCNSDPGAVLDSIQQDIERTASTTAVAQVTTSESEATTVTTAAVTETTAATEAQTSAAVTATEPVSGTDATEPPAQTTQTTTAATTTTATPTTTTATTASPDPTPLPDNSARDELFANRVRSPKTVVKSVGDVRYTVTLDREEYYAGDDINLRIKVENLGTEPIILFHAKPDDLNYEIRVTVCDDYGYPIDEISMGYTRAIPAVAESVYYWEPGVTLELLGRKTTYQGLAGEKLSLLISVGGTHYIELPLTVHADVPQDNELLPYLNHGEISNALYRRACVMNDTETVPIVIPKAWDRNNIIPGAQTQPIPNSYGYEDNLYLDFDGAVVYLTRAQLIDMLEYQSTGSRPALKYIYETIFKDILHKAYPLEALE